MVSKAGSSVPSGGRAPSHSAPKLAGARLGGTPIPGRETVEAPAVPDPSMRQFAALLLLLLAGCYEAGVDRAYNPTNEARHHYELAEAAVKSGNLDAAVLQAGRASAADPEFDDAALLHATLLGRVGRYDAALAVCETLTSRSPDLVQAHLLKGILGDQSGDLEAAHRSYDEVLERYAARRDSRAPGPRELLFEALARYLRHGELEGVRAVNEVLEQFPEHPTAQYLKGCMQHKDRGFLLRWFSEGLAPRQPVNRPGNRT